MKRLVVVSALISITACREPSPAPQERSREVPAVRAAPVERLAIIDDARAALAETAKRSAIAKELLDFYDANAIPALSADAGAQALLAPKKERAPFLVTVGPSLPRAPNGSSAVAEFRCHPHPVMTVYDHEMGAVATGMMMARALSHAQDCLSHGEPPSERLSHTWLLGELNGYVMSMLVLDQVSGGKWMEAVEKTRLKNVAKFSAGGDPLESLIIGIDPEDVALVGTVFGELDRTSLDAIASQLEIDANIVNFRIQGGLQGRSKDAILGHAIAYMRIYFQRR